MAQNSKMSIQQIAKEAQCCTATVSRYLNGGCVSENKRKIIKDVIERYNYLPSFSAQANRKSNNNVYLLVPDLTGSNEVIIAGILDEFKKERPELMVFLIRTTYNPDVYLQALKETVRRNPMAIILFNVHDDNSIKNFIKQIDTPIYTYNQSWSKVVFLNDDPEMATRLLDLIDDNEEFSKHKKFIYLGETIKNLTTGFLRFNYSEMWLKKHHPNLPLEKYFFEENCAKEINDIIDKIDFNDSVILVGTHTAYKYLSVKLKKRNWKNVCLAEFGYASFMDNFYLPSYRASINYRKLGEDIANQLLATLEHYDTISKTINIASFDIIKY